MNDLQNIKLPDFLVTDWYKSHLIETEVPTIAKPNNINITPVAPQEDVKEPSPAFVTVQKPVEVEWFIGKNLKNISIIISQNDSLVISKEWSTFLSSVLAACKFSLDDVVIINIQKKTINYTQIVQKFNSKYLLAFDVEPSLLGIPASIPTYDIRVDNNCAIIFSDSIAQMLGNTADAKQVKMKLWICLKKLFNV